MAIGRDQAFDTFGAGVLFHNDVACPAVAKSHVICRALEISRNN